MGEERQILKERILAGFQAMVNSETRRVLLFHPPTQETEDQWIMVMVQVPEEKNINDTLNSLRASTADKLADRVMEKRYS